MGTHLAAVADPNTGVAVYDSYGATTPGANWLVFGGEDASDARDVLMPAPGCVHGDDVVHALAAAGSPPEWPEPEPTSTDALGPKFILDRPLPDAVAAPLVAAHAEHDAQRDERN
jgi:hypothetical protein